MSDLPACFWLTRDRLGGELSDVVEVWACRPERHRSEDGDVIWLAPFAYLVGAVLEDSSIDEWTLAEATKQVGNGVPATDLECLCVGDPPPVVRQKVLA